jgi:hypothetical protein
MVCRGTGSNQTPGGVFEAIRGMTLDEICIAQALSSCRFVPGSPVKRFVRQMAGRDRTKPVSEAQRAYLWAIRVVVVLADCRRPMVDLAFRYSRGVGEPAVAETGCREVAGRDDSVDHSVWGGSAGSGTVPTRSRRRLRCGS